MKQLFLWIRKYFFNLFGVFGVVSGFCLSIFYVPDWVNQIIVGRASVVHESIISDVQEILFSDENISIYDIESLIKGKELNNGSTYQYNVEELLVQVEDRFMSNKFIPLKKRTDLVKEINQLREGIEIDKPQEKKWFKKEEIVPWLFSLLGILLSFFGVLSLFERNKREREINVDISEETSSETSNIKSSSVDSYYEFEKEIKELFTSIGFDIASEEADHPGKPLSRPDFEVSIGSDNYIVECKKYKQLVGLKTVNQAIYQGMEHGKQSILISTTHLTSRAVDALDKHNNKFPELKVYSLVGTRHDLLKAQLIEIKN